MSVVEQAETDVQSFRAPYATRVTCLLAEGMAACGYSIRRRENAAACRTRCLRATVRGQNGARRVCNGTPAHSGPARPFHGSAGAQRGVVIRLPAAGLRVKKAVVVSQPLRHADAGTRTICGVAVRGARGVARC